MKSFALRKNRALIESLGEIVNVFFSSAELRSL